MNGESNFHSSSSSYSKKCRRRRRRRLIQEEYDFYCLFDPQNYYGSQIPLLYTCNRSVGSGCACLWFPLSSLFHQRVFFVFVTWVQFVRGLLFFFSSRLSLSYDA